MSCKDCIRDRRIHQILSKKMPGNRPGIYPATKTYIFCKEQLVEIQPESGIIHTGGWKYMKKQSNCISQNLTTLRQYHKYSQEEVAEKIGVSRQAVAKWEAGETVPDILNCDALATLYDVSVDDLIHFDQDTEQMAIPPRGKHLFGTVKVGERGQIVLPKKARDLFGINSGDLLVVLGDENPASAGIALVLGDTILQNIAFLRNALHANEKEEENT